jgi:hypothetical protein
MPLSGIDDAWPTRIPQGWQQFPDGSIGPPNPVGSDWNAPYRGAPGVPDWLRQLIPSPGANIPYGPGAAGIGLGGHMPTAGAVAGYSQATPGAPSMGFPAQGGPDIFPPQNSPIPNYKSVGPFTGGTSTENAPPGDSYWNPRNWFRGGQAFTPGQPMGPEVTGGGGGFNPLSALGGGNPYWRGLIAGGGVLSPTPAETGELPLSLSGARPMHPPSTGAMPPSDLDGGHPDVVSYPHMPWPPGAPATPPGNPSATPRPATPYPPRRPKNLGVTPAPAAAPSSSNKWFGLYQPQVPGSGQGGPLSRSPIYTTLNLFGR